MSNSSGRSIVQPPRRSAAAPPAPLAPPRGLRRRTLGLCAHCHKVVDFGSEYVRLNRRAWHLECALAADPATEQPPPD